MNAPGPAPKGDLRHGKKPSPDRPKAKGAGIAPGHLFVALTGGVGDGS